MLGKTIITIPICATYLVHSYIYVNIESKLDDSDYAPLITHPY